MLLCDHVIINAIDALMFVAEHDKMGKGLSRDTLYTQNKAEEGGFNYLNYVKNLMNQEMQEKTICK